MDSHLMHFLNWYSKSIITIKNKLYETESLNYLKMEEIAIILKETKTIFIWKLLFKYFTILFFVCVYIYKKLIEQKERKLINVNHFSFSWWILILQWLFIIFEARQAN